MPMPKSNDPKVSISIRVRRSLLEVYQAKGDDWRGRMHEALEAGVNGSVPKEALEPIRATAKAALDVLDKAVETPASRGLDLPLGPTPRKFGDLAKKGTRK